MPFVEYFQTRSKQRKITGPDALDLISSSTVTHKAVGAVYQPLPHPPHPHAHVHKEGFQHNPLSHKQQHKLQQLEKHQAQMHKHGLGLGNLHKDTLRDLQQQKVANTEGLHLDPATRGMMDPRYQVVDPKQAYINRKKHSQFEDGEVAVMALVHALNTPAGEDAMAQLKQVGHRVVVHSKSAAEALNQGPVAYKNAPKKLSAHPQRGQVPQVIERGKGGAGVAPIPAKGMVGVVSVIDRVPGAAGDELVLTTHYPVAANGPAQDVVEVWDMGAKPKKLLSQNLHKTVIPAGPPPVEWSLPEPGWIRSFFVSRNEGMACVQCASQHGAFPSQLNPWFQCQRCGNVFCTTHGRALAAQATPDNPHGRACSRSGCGGATRYIY